MTVRVPVRRFKVCPRCKAAPLHFYTDDEFRYECAHCENCGEYIYQEDRLEERLQPITKCGKCNSEDIYCCYDEYTYEIYYVCNKCHTINIVGKASPLFIYAEWNKKEQKNENSTKSK